MNKQTRITPKAPGKEPKILISIIDDDESIRDGLAGLMHWLEFDVAIFASASEFLASPALATSACIVSDVQMPQMTGFELHAHLLAIGRDIPMILITAYFSEDAKIRALSSGIVCYLRKPFDTDVLIKCIRSVIAAERA